LLGLTCQPPSLTQVVAEMLEKFGEIHPAMLGPTIHNNGAHYNGCYYGLLLGRQIRIQPTRP
jgi:hypothetical protein